MANVLIFKDGEQPKYLSSVNTPEYLGNPNVIINPDISTVNSVEMKFWKRSGDLIVEMNDQEKQATLEVEEASKDQSIEGLSIDTSLLARILLKTGLITKADIVKQIEEVKNG